MKSDSRDISIFPELNNLKLLFGLYTFLFITDYIMPQYFGVHIGYDITCTRLANILIVAYFLFNGKMLTLFGKTIFECALTPPLVAYIFVAAYTMVLRTDVNSLFLVFLEVLTLYMLIFGIRYVIGYKRAIKWSIGCAYFFSIYGLIEFVYGRSLYLQFLSTVPTTVINTYRSGYYRIMGPCGHPLAYGLLLILILAIVSIDYEKNEVYLFKRPVLVVLLYLNIFLTGSRSTLGIAILEGALIFLFGGKKNIQKSLFMLAVIVAGLATFLLLFGNSSIGRYIMMQLASVFDQVFGTEFAVNFGADVTRLQNSEGYRQFLPRIFTLDWLNPLLGRGVSASFGAEFDGVFIVSIDNFYVAQYIKYAYPGMISYIAFIVTSLGSMIFTMLKYKSAVAKMAFVGTLCYFINLWWLDALQTTKYVYIVIAIFYAAYMNYRDEEKYRWGQK